MANFYIPPPEQMTVTQQLTAFWRYDQFPFCLSGAVTEFVNDGGVRLGPNWNCGVVKPLAVMPKQAGDEIARKVKELDSEYRAELAAVRKKYNQRLVEIAPFLAPVVKVGS